MSFVEGFVRGAAAAVVGLLVFVAVFVVLNRVVWPLGEQVVSVFDQRDSLTEVNERRAAIGLEPLTALPDTRSLADINKARAAIGLAPCTALPCPITGTQPASTPAAGSTSTPVASGRQAAPPSSGTGSTGSFKTGCDGKDVGAVQALIGLNVVCLGTEFDAYTWRSVPMAVDAVCPSGWICTLHLKSNDRVVVVQGDGSKHNIVAGTFRRIAGYPNGDGVHNACELLRKEQAFGASQTPRFNVDPQGFSCNGTTVTSSSASSGSATSAITQGAVKPPVSNSTDSAEERVKKVASAVGGKTSDWKAIEGSSNGYKFIFDASDPNRAVPDLKVPESSRIDHPSGSSNPGQTVNTREATLWILS